MEFLLLRHRRYIPPGETSLGETSLGLFSQAIVHGNLTKRSQEPKEPKQSVCVAHCYFNVHVNVLYLPFASPKAIYR